MKQANHHRKPLRRALATSFVGAILVGVAAGTAGAASHPGWYESLAIRSEGLDKLYADVTTATAPSQPGWYESLAIRSEGLDKLYADTTTEAVKPSQPGWYESLAIRSEGLDKLYSGPSA